METTNKKPNEMIETLEYSFHIESIFGLCGPLSLSKIHDGPDNNVYLVVDNKGEKYALRESKRPEKDISFEIEVLANLARLGFSVPNPIKVIEENGVQFVLFNYISGDQIRNLNEENINTNVLELGARKFGELHSHTNNMRVEAISNRTIFTEFDRLLRLSVGALRQYEGYEIFLEQVRKYYDEAKLRIKDENELCGVIHNDYRVQNLIYAKDDCFIIDFDWATYGPLLKDLGLAVAVWSSYTKDGLPSKLLIDRFLASYNQTAPRAIVYDEDLIFWICFACLSDACTFFADLNGGQHPDKVITNVEQCYMYQKYKFFAPSK
ncbi:MAG: phosphotransferase [Candidatus Paceibacterota bacterium]